MSKERKGYTDEQKAAIKARRDERNAATRTLIDMIIKVKTNEVTEEFLSDIKELANIAKPKTSAGTGSGNSRVSIASQVSALFDENTEVDELTVFQNLHLGRKEMATAIKNIIKNAKPEDRKWITFVPEDGLYVLEGTGADAPEGWTGYIPVEEVAADDSDSDESEDEE